MTAKRHGDRFTCQDCNRVFLRRGVHGGIPVTCDECRKARHVASVMRWRKHNPGYHAGVMRRARARRRRKEAQGTPV